MYEGVMAGGAKEICFETKEVGPLNQTDCCYERGVSTLFYANKTTKGK